MSKLKEDRMKWFVLILVMLASSGCARATGEVYAESDLVRGLSYVASAIVTHGVIQAIFRK